MRYVLYFLVYSCVLIGVFISFLYLMTVVDPGLLKLPEKAVKMMKANTEDIQEGVGELPSEMYIDFSELLKKPKDIQIKV